MSSEHPKCYTDCGHTINEVLNGPDVNGLSNSIAEIIKGLCPDCTKAPRIPIQMDLESLVSGQLKSDFRKMTSKAQEFKDTLEAEETKAMLSEEYGSTCSAPMDYSSNAEEIAGKENLDSRRPSAEKLKAVTLTVTSIVTPTTRRSGHLPDASPLMKDENIVCKTDALPKETWSINRIRSHFDVMREKIDSANKRMSDINDFKLADFMGHSIEKWTMDVKQAIQECEVAMVKDYNDLVAGSFDPSSG